jgi:ATP-dependent helicase/DNAse subunit B
MVKNMLDYDKKHTPFEILGLEQEHFFERNGIKIGGIIDRIDKVNGKIRVVDYKTGKIPNENDFAKEISVVFSPNRPKKAGYQFQTYLYSSILSENENYKGFEVAPNLIFVLQSEIEKEKINGLPEIFPEIKEKFDKNLVEKLQELFNPEIPFKQSEKSDKCKYCDYCGICGREIINI